MGGGALAKVGEVAVKYCRSLAVGEVGFVLGVEAAQVHVVAVNSDLGLPFATSLMPRRSFVL